MVMGKRPDVKTSPLPVTVLTVGGLAARLGTALATVPLRQPWRGPDDVAHNVGQSVTREVMRAFMGYSATLPTDQFRSIEVLLDDLCRVVLPPFVNHLEVAWEDGHCGGIPGVWYRPKALGNKPRGSILYLHGGGYVGTSPFMYAAFTGYLAAETGCEVFVADYRLAPEFPFPAALNDAIDVFEGFLDRGVNPDRIVVAGDSGGGGLVTSLLLDASASHLPPPGACVLFSPEVDLGLDEPSVTENAGLDILPRQIPVKPYLADHDPKDGLVSAIYADCSRFPPTLVGFGDEEMFRDPIRTFVARLRDEGVEVEAHEEPDMFHMYMILMPWADASRRLYRAVASFVDGHLAPIR